MNLGALFFTVEGKADAALKSLTQVEGAVKHCESVIGAGLGRIKGFFNQMGEGAMNAARMVDKHKVMILAAAAAIQTAITAPTIAAVRYGEEIDRLSKISGIAAETMQQLSYAAKQEFVSIEQLAIGIRQLARNAYEAKDKTSESAKAFREMGISVKDGNGQLRPLLDLMLEVADYMQRAGNAGEKAALSMRVFGKAGADIVPFLSLGRAEIQRLMVEYDRYAGTLSGEAIAATEEFGDVIQKLKEALAGLWRSVITPMIPDMTRYANSIADVVKQLREWNNSLGGIPSKIALIAAELSVLELVATVVVAKIITSLGSLVTFVKANPVLSAVFLVAYVASLYAFSDDVQNAMVRLWNILKAFFDLVEAKLASWGEGLWITAQMIVEKLRYSVEITLAWLEARIKQTGALITSSFDQARAYGEEAARYEASYSELMSAITSKWETVRESADRASAALADAAIKNLLRAVATPVPELQGPPKPATPVTIPIDTKLTQAQLDAMAKAAADAEDELNLWIAGLADAVGQFAEERAAREQAINDTRLSRIPIEPGSLALSGMPEAGAAPVVSGGWTDVKDELKNMTIRTGEIVSAGISTISGSISNGIMGIISGTMTGAQALKAIGMSILGFVISTLTTILTIYIAKAWIPGLQHGATIARGGLAMIHSAEVVSPIKGLREAMLGAITMARQTPELAMAGGGGMHIDRAEIGITVDNKLDADQIVEIISRRLEMQYGRGMRY